MEIKAPVDRPGGRKTGGAKHSSAFVGFATEAAALAAMLRQWALRIEAGLTSSRKQQSRGERGDQGGRTFAGGGKSAGSGPRDAGSETGSVTRSGGAGGGAVGGVRDDDDNDDNKGGAVPPYH